MVVGRCVNAVRTTLILFRWLVPPLPSSVLDEATQLCFFPLYCQNMMKHTSLFHSFVDCVLLQNPIILSLFHRIRW